MSENDITKKAQTLRDVIMYTFGLMQKESESQINSRFIDSSASRASLLGFIVLELLNVVFPLSNINHKICLSLIAIYLLIAFIKYGRVPKSLNRGSRR